MSKIKSLLNSINIWCRQIPGNVRRIWLISAGALMGVTILIILLTVPIITVAVETREPSYVTTTSSQPYTVTEYSVTDASIPKTAILAEGYYTVVPSGIIVPFLVDKPGSRLTGVFENTIPGSFVIYNSSNRIIYEKLGNRGTIDLFLPPGNYRAKFQENVMWGEDVYISLALGWTEIEQRTTAQEVSRYHEVPVQVSTDRIVLKEDKYSIWELVTRF